MQILRSIACDLHREDVGWLQVYYLIPTSRRKAAISGRKDYLDSHLIRRK
jgi:hypothetical protein